MKKYIIFLMLILFMGLVSSEVNEYASVKQNECAILSQVCASCTYANMSIKYPSPNSTYAQYEVPMQRDGGGDWYYSFCNTSLVGRYDITGHGDLSGIDTGFDVLSLTVTPSGNVLDSAGSTTLFGSLLLMLILSVVFILIAMKSEGLPARVTMYSIAAIMILMSILYTVVAIQQVLFGFTGIITGIETLLFVAKIGITIGTIAFGIVILLIMLKAWKIKRGLCD